MARQLEAVFEQGVLRPLEPLFLSENQRVQLTLEEAPAPLSWETNEPINERSEELRWLAEQSEAYAGQWVALDGSKLIAHGNKLAAVSEEARSSGVAQPFFARVPKDKDTPFGGW